MKTSRLIFLLLLLIGNKVWSSNRDSLLKVANNKALPDTAIFYAYYELGWEYIYSNSDTSLLYAQQAFRCAKRSNSRLLQAKTFNLLGAYYQVNGGFVQAIDYYQKSLELGEHIKNDEVILKASGNIGALYITMGKYQKGLEYQLRGEIAAKKTNDIKTLASIYNNISLVYGKFLNYRKSLDYARQSLELYNKLDDENGIIAVYGNMGSAYVGLKKNDEAIFYFKKSNELAKKAGNIYEQIEAYNDIAGVYTEQKKLDTAIFYHLIAEKEALKIDQQEALKSTYQSLYKIFKSKKDIKKALEYHEKYISALELSFQNESEHEVEKREFEHNFKRQAIQDSIKYALESEKKQAQIEKDQAQIEKDKLFKIALTFGLVLVLVFSVVIFNRFKLTNKQNKIIEIRSRQTEEQKQIIELKNKEILDSINYAKRIQDGLLANIDLMTSHLSDYFVFFKPKDIVSGDFYWATEFNNKFYLAVCDSTGHGVPGAFMSLLNIGLLSEAIKEKGIQEPHLVLNYVRDRLIETISGDGHSDGMDGIIMCLEKQVSEGLKITYAAANNQPMVVKRNELIELPKDRMPISKAEKLDSFTLHTIDLEKGDMLYLYTDGYADQFGGPQEKKFKYKSLNQLLLSNAKKTTDEQWQLLNDNFNYWKGNLEQVDDVCIVGIKA